MTTYGYAGWMIWATKPNHFEWPTNPRPGDIVVRADGTWHIWNGRQWKTDNRHTKGAA